LKGSIWIEIKDKADALETFETKMVDELLKRADKKEVSFDTQTKQLVLDENLQKDIVPDHIAEINSQINKKWHDKKDRSVTVKGVTATANDNIQDDDGITWHPVGAAIVPKSI